MAEKKFCDICGRDITTLAQYSFEIYNDSYKRQVTQGDLCKAHRFELVAAIAEMRRRARARVKAGGR
ncbi:MAG: hypothetical protein U1B94_01390 [candidate division NC10 bacterium]|nr:hypothetical protein [candidate division NC10 bacterium]